MTAALDTVSRHMGAVLTGLTAANTDATQGIPCRTIYIRSSSFVVMMWTGSSGFAALIILHLCFITQLD